MKTKNNRKIFLSLVPHRDIRGLLRKYSNDLFSAGFYGAYSFPWVAPLAELKKPFTEEELKYTAGSIRETLGDSKITSKKTASVELTQSLKLFGPCLDLSFQSIINHGVTRSYMEKPDKFKTPCSSVVDKIKSIFPDIVIGSCILDGSENEKLTAPPDLSFRAAAVTNMFWQHSSEENFFIWKIEKLYWLPKKPL